MFLGSQQRRTIHNYFQVIVAKWSLTLHEGYVFLDKDGFISYHVASRNRTKEQAEAPCNVIMACFPT